MPSLLEVIGDALRGGVQIIQQRRQTQVCALALAVRQASATGRVDEWMSKYPLTSLNTEYIGLVRVEQQAVGGGWVGQLGE